jgi:hypothetical protein
MLVFVCGINSAEPASAAKTKLIDKGSVTFFDAEEGKYVKYAWKTYKKGNNYVFVKGTMYYDGFGISSNYYLVKTSKAKLYFKATVAGKKAYSQTIKINLNAVKFYSKYLRPELKSGDMFTG